MAIEIPESKGLIGWGLAIIVGVSSLLKNWSRDKSEVAKIEKLVADMAELQRDRAGDEFRLLTIEREQSEVKESIQAHVADLKRDLRDVKSQSGIHTELLTNVRIAIAAMCARQGVAMPQLPSETSGAGDH